LRPQVFKFSAPKPVVGDSVNQSQFVTGCPPQSRSQFAILKDEENGLNAHPHPGVDSLAPARSALRAFGFAEFLSPIPNRLKSLPKEKENRSPRFGNVVRRRLADVRRAIRERATAVPSPWGEGQGEGGRKNKSRNLARLGF
jgi:hypothetical protein